ncbi:Methyltransferase domain-containing protein OS=Streptomyces tendae OX=1932 GN=GUR47_20350 PE=4 SV=1 [Streptomyces tendae]
MKAATRPGPARKAPAPAWTPPTPTPPPCGRDRLLFLRRADGWLLPLEVERWCARADTVDLEVLDRCEGAVLDVGCGPGRLVAELAARGRTVLGIDVSEAAVARTVRLGGQCLRRSVFEPLPGEGRWDTVLLMDGNVGIGGDPRALLALRRRPAGTRRPADRRDGSGRRRRTHPRPARRRHRHPHRRQPLPLGAHSYRALLRRAGAAGWRTAGQWTSGGRRFVALRSSRPASSTAEPPNSTAVISSQRVRKPSADSPVTPA